MIQAAIVGIGGYTGQELARMVLQHPLLALTAVFGSDSTAGQPIEAVTSSLRGVLAGKVRAGNVGGIITSGAEAVFLATPHEASASLAPTLLEAGLRVVDLSAAFRLRDASLYPRYYGFDHPSPELLDRAVYGLPERYRSDLAGATLIAAPGCYPTSVIVPVAPLVKAGLIAETRPVIVDSTSGVSGAGRKANERTSFCEVSQSPYGVFTHRHGPEIDTYCNTPTIFTPHMGPYARGICSTIHADVAPGVSESDIRNQLSSDYDTEPFVRLLPSGAWPSVAGVVGTNFVDIGLAVDADRGHLIVVSCIDNLIKGASGQAIQAFNASMGWNETLGLPPGASGGGAA